MEQLGSHWTDFDEILLVVFLRKSVEKFQVSLKSDQKTGTLHEDIFKFVIIFCQILLGVRSILGQIAEKKKRTFYVQYRFF